MYSEHASRSKIRSSWIFLTVLLAIDVALFLQMTSVAQAVAVDVTASGNSIIPNRPNATTSTTTVSSSSNPSKYGESVILTATVTAGATGIVTFTIDSTVVTRTLSASKATVVTNTLSVGTHTVAVDYGGGGGFDPSNGTLSGGQQVNKADTTTTITNGGALGTASVVGQAYAVNYSVTVNSPGGGTPTGNVVVSDGTDSCTGTVAAGTCNLTSTTTGGKTITATYQGDSSNYNASPASSGVGHTVSKADTTTTLASSGSSVFGQTAYFTATVTVNNPGSGAPTGTVQFYADGSTLGSTVPLTSGSASANTSTLSVATHTITATYSGDVYFNTSNGNLSGGQQVDKANTTATITNSGALGTATVVGQSYTVNYTVTVNSPGIGSPSGNVVVSDGTDSCTGTVAAGTCNLTSTTSGSKTITATYQGDGSNFNASPASSGIGHTVNNANTTAAITNSGALGTASVVGQSYPVNYTVIVNSPGSGTPTGNVVVSDGTDTCTATVAAGTCNLTSTTSGTKSITATYQGDGNYNSNSSGSYSHTVNKADTTTTITNGVALGTASVVGQAYAVNYLATVNSPGGGTPTGNVVVSDGTDSCTGTVAAATCNITSTIAGSKTITATYQGDSSNYNASPASSGVGHTVNKANTTTALATSGSPSVYGQTVYFTATVTVNSPGSGTPSGTVQFYADGTTIDSAVTVSSGSASVNTSTLSVTTHIITTTYSGDTKFNTSNSTLSGGQQVNKANTTTTIASSGSSVFGQTAYFTATVTAQSPGSGTPSGTVQFYADGTTIGSAVTLSSGSASANTSTLSVATHTITATYSGDTKFNTSNGTLSGGQHVNKANTTATITNSGALGTPTVVGQQYAVNYLVTVNSPGSGSPSGNVVVSDGTDSCTATVAAGTCNLTSTTSGSKSITATYQGDGSNFNASPASTGVGHTVNNADTAATITNGAALGTPSVVGQSYAVNYQVFVPAPGSGTPTGNVVVSDGTDSCTATVAAGTCNLTSTTAGSKSITATYQGDGNYNSNATGSYAHTVNKADTTTTITSSGALATASVVGQPYTVNYTVTVNSPGGGTPTSNVVVSDGTDSCTGTVAAGTCNLTSTTAGSKSITATYQGNSNYNASPASSGVAHTVNKANTTTTITNGAALGTASQVGQAYTVNYTVIVNSPGSGSPSGNVVVSDGTNSCTGTVSAGTCNLSSTTTGGKTITATYQGDGSNFNPSPASTGVAHTVGNAIVYLPLTLRNYPPTAPKPGYWASTTGQSFFVNADSTLVTFFTDKFNVPGCGLTGQTITENNISISSSRFHFNDGTHFGGGAFAADVTFTGSLPYTTANGWDQVTNYFISGCSTNVHWSPFPFTATWQSANPPAAPSRGPFRDIIPLNKP